jgi:hypothetical protein
VSPWRRWPRGTMPRRAGRASCFSHSHMI